MITNCGRVRFLYHVFIFFFISIHETKSQVLALWWKEYLKIAWSVIMIIFLLQWIIKSLASDRSKLNPESNWPIGLMRLNFYLGLLKQKFWTKVDLFCFLSKWLNIRRVSELAGQKHDYNLAFDILARLFVVTSCLLVLPLPKLYHDIFRAPTRHFLTGQHDKTTLVFAVFATLECRVDAQNF